jgi:2-oxoglutarate dehydrogenase complex dehydrogenase (E1) component-like enzyme
VQLACTLAPAVTYLEELEKRFHDDPASVDRSWAAFFTNLGAHIRRSCVAAAVLQGEGPINGRHVGCAAVEVASRKQPISACSTLTLGPSLRFALEEGAWGCAGGARKSN